MKRNKFIPKLIFMFPIVIMCIMPWVMDMEVRNVSVCIVDNDHSVVSSKLIEKIKSAGSFQFSGLYHNNKDAVQAVENGSADVILTIPRCYGRDVESGHGSEVLITANAVNGIKGSMGAYYLSAIAGTSAKETAHIKNLPERKTDAVSDLYLYNKHLGYKVFMIPALMSVLIIMICGFLPALNIVNEREQGTIEQINVSPVKPWVFVLAKLVPYWVAGVMVLTVCLMLSWLVYGLTPAGNITVLYVLSMLLALCFSGLGLVVSRSSGSMQQAVLTMWFIVVCMMLLSGMFTPVGSMPDWAGLITLVNPVRWYVDAMRTVFVRGGGLSDVALPCAVLAASAAVAGFWAIRGYRKN